MYDIRDVLRKAVLVSNRKRQHFEGILDNTPDIRLRAILQIIIRDIDKDIEYYEMLIEQYNHEKHIQEIDFGLYDTISNLVNQYVRHFVKKPRFKERGPLIQYALDTEKSAYALLVDIQGRLAQFEGLEHSQSYFVLSELLAHKHKSIINLEMFAKQTKT